MQQTHDRRQPYWPARCACFCPPEHVCASQQPSVYAQQPVSAVALLLIALVPPKGEGPARQALPLAYSQFFRMVLKQQPLPQWRLCPGMLALLACRISAELHITGSHHQNQCSLQGGMSVCTCMKCSGLHDMLRQTKFSKKGNWSRADQAT